VCHGAGGRGDGPSARALATRPADLVDRGAYSQGADAASIAATLASGLRGRTSAMPPYAHLPIEDRVALAEYLVSRQQ
jgi:mono/diheme cytochrome c family protein